MQNDSKCALNGKDISLNLGLSINLDLSRIVDDASHIQSHQKIEQFMNNQTGMNKIPPIVSDSVIVDK